MIRIEIIANHSVEENILEELQHEQVAAHYTRYPGVFGVGSSGPRMGDAIWPEENFVLVVWCEEKEAASIERAVAAVKKHFPDEGIKLFKMSDAPREVAYLPPQQAARTESAPPASTTGNAAGDAPPTKRSYAGPEGENS